MTPKSPQPQPANSDIRIAFFGTPEFSVPILNSICQNKSVDFVVSQPDKPVGRGLKLSPSPISKFALGHHLPLLRPTDLSQDAFQASLLKTLNNQTKKTTAIEDKLPDIDIIVVAAYGQILPKWLLDWPRLGCLNIHTSLLPKYRGASPITAALLDGLTQTGITFMQMDQKMDQGPIITQIPVPIDQYETGDSLYVKMSHTASKHINEVLDRYASNPHQVTPQDHNQATYTQQITKQDGYLDLDNLPANWQNRIYAYHPWPGAWTIFQGTRLKLLPHSQVQPASKTPTPLQTYLTTHPDFPLKEDW